MGPNRPLHRLQRNVLFLQLEAEPIVFVQAGGPEFVEGREGCIAVFAKLTTPLAEGGSPTVGTILVTDSSLLRPEYSSSSLRSSSKSVSVASERGRAVDVRDGKMGTGPFWNISDSFRRRAADVKASQLSALLMVTSRRRGQLTIERAESEGQR